MHANECCEHSFREPRGPNQSSFKHLPVFIPSVRGTVVRSCPSIGDDFNLAGTQFNCRTVEATACGLDINYVSHLLLVIDNTEDERNLQPGWGPASAAWVFHP